MGRKELQELFCAKISLEIGRFKGELIEQGAEEVYAHAYQIDCMINIYERLLELSQGLGNEVLAELLMFPGLLAFLYEEWLSEEDSSAVEMWRSIRKSIGTIGSTTIMEQGKEGNAA